jgi:LuxR family maltose regulon positive regulatory protein
MVVRSRLVLPETAPRIILVCAPAGYGKTTLISSWTAASRLPTAWLSLDAGDNDPTRFLMHFITAVQTHHSDFGKIIIDMLSCTPPAPVTGLMRSLVNQLCSLPERLCVIMDDLHLVSGEAVSEVITFLVDNQPPQLQLIFASRNDPPFSLARLRGQRQLLEYRASDLRFTLQEAQAFCNDVMHFDLSDNQVETLTTRTEGWIVGLQLAAVSMLNNADKSGFIDSFAGNHRHVTDFLLDEVLRSRSTDVQNFLLQTSLLERFNASLCDAVTGRDDSRAMIDEMERTNMFIVGLDHQRLWYRYHHLFTSLLHSRLEQTYPAQVKALHQRASQWFSDNDLVAEAIHHAIKAADFVFAAELIEKHGGALFSHGRITTVLGWTDQLPREVLEKRPVLSILCAWGSFYMDDMTALGRHIQTSALCLPNAHSAPFGSTERVMFGQLAIMRGCHFGYNGNLDDAIAQFKEALASFSLGRTLYRAAKVCLGVCYFAAGKLNESQELLEEHASISEITNNLLVPISAILCLARVHLLRGNLVTAKQIYIKAMSDCQDAGWQDFPACSMLHIGLGELAYEMNDLALAEQHLQRGVEMTSVGMWCFNVWARVLLAQTKIARGTADNVLCVQSEAMMKKYSGRFIVDVVSVSAVTGKLWLRQRCMETAAQWVAKAQLSTSGELTIGREAEYLVLTRYLIASGEAIQANLLLEKMWDSAEQGGRVMVMIEILIVKAIALQAVGDMPSALASLRQAVTLAENKNLLRLFLDDSEAITSLLKKLARGSDYTSHAHYLLGQIAIEKGQMVSKSADPFPLLFSKKEKQVVSYIVNGSSKQEIASALFISSNTVNSHVKSIYSKLGVNSRMQAVERLRKLGVSSSV